MKMLKSLIHMLFWSRIFEEVREGHKELCYSLGKSDAIEQMNNQFYIEFSNSKGEIR